MTRRALVLVLVALVGCVIASSHALADTGTYKITDYRVKLTPRSDGAVLIEYHQTWLVTGGSIPWITVGTPNGNFEIIRAASQSGGPSVRPANEGGWSGVRIDLDKNYRAGETFEVGFTILQQGLFYAKDENYRLEFTPGWYDQAEIAHLAVEVFFFAKIETVAAQPEPSRRAGQSLFWEKDGLRPGQRFPIAVAFPKGLFPAGLKTARPVGAGSFVDSNLPCIVMAIVCLVGLLLLLKLISRAGGIGGVLYGAGGHIFFPASHGGRSGGGGGIFSGGGGDFGGRAASCACACAGCACACACAGGGAAGCDRKLYHTCPACRSCESAECLSARRARP